MTDHPAISMTAPPDNHPTMPSIPQITNAQLATSGAKRVSNDELPAPIRARLAQLGLVSQPGAKPAQPGVPVRR
jgi:hypothetical protein